MRALGVVFAFLALAAVAGGATVPPDIVPARLTLQVADVPGATAGAQGPVHEQGYAGAYQRTFSYRTPRGSSGFRFLQSEALLAATTAKAAAAVDRMGASFASKTWRAAYAAAIARALAVKVAAVRVSAPRTPRVGDRAVELPLSVLVAGRRVYESVLYVQLDRVVGVLVSSGIRPIAAPETRALAALAAGHVVDALKPAALAAPAVSGDAQVGATISATTGDWRGDVTFTNQWQRCQDAATACTDIPGATAATYTAVDADAGMELRIVVTAANRFGTATASSELTPAVAPPPPPPELP